MPCLDLPDEPFPTLPEPFTIAPPPLPDIPSEDIDLCCKSPPVKIPPLPIKIPSLVVNAALVALLQDGIKTVTDYLDQIPLDCPKE